MDDLASLQLVHRLSALADRKPHDDRSLHAYVKAIVGLHVPRVATCPGHHAPFGFVADAFFKRHSSYLVLASRGGGKTQNLAILNYLMSKFWPHTGTAHYGAIEAQSTWGFEYLTDILSAAYTRRGLVVDKKNYFKWGNGSWVRVGSGRTVTGVTAIRPQRLVLDEVDLWEEAQYETAQLMISTAPGQIPQRIAASTAYNAYGLMSVLLSQKQKRQQKLYQWCLFETLERCTSCKRDKCPLFVWRNPRVDKLEPLCRGRGLKADGFVPWKTAVDEFYSVDAETFAVQKLLLAPEKGGLIYPTWSPEVHGEKADLKLLRGHASIGIGVDWGFDHPLVFVVVAQMPNGKYYAVEEYGERFASPDRELELAVSFNEKYRRGNVYPTFYPGKDQPGSIAAFVEAGLTVVPNVVRLRDDGHRYVRRLLDPNKGPLLKVDLKRCPMLAAVVPCWPHN